MLAWLPGRRFDAGDGHKDYVMFIGCPGHVEDGAIFLETCRRRIEDQGGLEQPAIKALIREHSRIAGHDRIQNLTSMRTDGATHLEDIGEVRKEAEFDRQADRL